ncbi:sugar phosphate isomerase/epimerase [Amycolatopsis stemonae]
MTPPPAPEQHGVPAFAPCLNPATLTSSPLPRFLDLAAAAGFGAVELAIQQIQAHDAVLVREWLDRRGLTLAAASGILPAGPVMPAPLLIPPDTYAVCLDGLDERLMAFADVGCRVATIVLNPRSGLPQGEALELAVDRIGRLADAAAEREITLAVEVVSARAGLPVELDGPHPVAATLPELAELLARAGRANTTVLVDSFHWAAAGADPRHIAELGPGGVGHVQIADLPLEVARTECSDAQRLLPGDGAMPWTVFADALTAAGYTGPASVELFNPDLWALPAEDLARRSFAAASSCWVASEVAR